MELVIRPKNSIFSQLQSIMQGGKQLSEPPEIRISMQIELDGSDDAERKIYKPLPAPFRTLQLNTDGVCWLEPSRRWMAIRKWIQTCLGEHDRCRGDGVIPELPTRYLDIGTGDHNAVKVVTSDGARGEYACLSHCWGGKSECTLTAKTMALFTKFVPRRVLPPVFSNAVAVCRRLGIRRDFPLLTRAWVLQERWLSPRVLHVCGSEVVLEWSEATVCEFGRATQDMMSTLTMNAVDSSTTAASWATRSTTTSQEGLLSRRIAVTSVPWGQFVSTYSCLSLTFPKDRLTAVSGIASKIYNNRYKNSNDKEGKMRPSVAYLAGLWRDTLVKDLAWFVGPTLLKRTAKGKLIEIVGSGLRRKIKPREYLAPS